LIVAVGSAYGLHKKLLFEWFKTRGEKIVFKKLRETELLEAGETIKFDYSHDNPNVTILLDSVIDSSAATNDQTKLL
jgi:hypothetical protein